MKTLSLNHLNAGVAPFALALAAIAGSAQAQEAASPAGAGSDDQVIVVTGSRISRPDLQASSPVSVISGENFQTFNSPNAEKLLSVNPQFLPSATSSVNNGNPGAATIDIRGLGAERTLVLVDGKRMVSYDYSGIVDINAIPVALIKRVDVLSGGASAVYGSDAVSGVVNFILDDQFTGLRMDGSTQITGRGDGQIYDASLTGGLRLGDRGNIVASVGYTKRETVYQSARDYSKFALSSDDLVSPGGSSTTAPTNFDNTFVDDEEYYYQIGAGNNLVPFYEPYNYAPPNYLIVPQERWQGTVLARYELTDAVEAFARGSYLHSKVASQSAPTGTFGYSFDIFPDNPYLTSQQRDLFFNGIGAINSDGSTTVNIRRRMVELGGRTTNYDSKAWQVVGGFRGEIANNYKWEVFGQFAKTKREVGYQNDITYARVQQALDARLVGGKIVCRDTSNGCAPLNLFTVDPIGPDALKFITAQGKQSDRNQQFVTGASLSGDFGALSPLSDKAIGFAVGAEYRKEQGESDIDAAFASGELIGYGQGQVFPLFSYDVKEAFGELQLPLVSDKPFIRDLSIEAGARFADYSTVGSVFSWKGGGNWSPADGIRFRTMYQRAVRAPNLAEISSPQVSGIDNLDIDPCAGSAPVGNVQLTALCIATGAPAGQIGRIAAPVSGQINAFYGGNPNLKAEKSDTITIGMVLTPSQVPGMTLSVDYYSIKIKNAIDVFGGSPQNVISGCYTITRDANSDYCKGIHRNTLSGSLSGGIDYGVDQFNFNSAQRKTSGVDVNFGYRRQIGAIRTEFNLSGTYIDTYEKQGAAFIPATQCAGKFGYACNLAPMPKWKHIASLSAGTDAVTLTGRWRFIGKVSQDEGTDILASKLPAYSFFDLTAAFDVADRFTLRIGMENVFDKNPPLVGADAASTAVNSGNTFPTVYDPLGRTIFAGVSAKF